MIETLRGIRVQVGVLVPVEIKQEYRGAKHQGGLVPQWNGRVYRWHRGRDK